MKLSLLPPTNHAIDYLLAEQARHELSYPEIGCTRDAERPAGYAVDHNQVVLGEGEEVWRAACRALNQWQMFELPWVRLYWPEVEPEPGAVVAVAARYWGMWFVNCCRVVYRIEDEIDRVRRYGFAYGTLPVHGERGEERFLIEQAANGRVFYDLLAYSKPNHWLTWLGYPVARRLQKRFAMGSLNAMIISN